MVRQRPGLIGNLGWVRSKAWIWLFSSIDNTTACAGGSTPRVRPTVGPRAGSESDDVGELGGKAGIARALEGAKPVRLKFVRPPDALHRTHRDAGGFGHCPAGPMRGLVRRVGADQRHHPRRGFRRDRRLARLAGLVAQQTSTPTSAKRCCQRHTVGRLTPMRCATCCADVRSAEASTMRARSMCLRGRLRSAAIAANSSRSAVLKITHTRCAMAPSPTMAQYRTSDDVVNPLNDSKH